MEKINTKKTKRESETILPNDLLEEILLRLPAKSLAQCKCLSRHWKSRISDRRFIKTHVARYHKPNNTLIHYEASDVRILPRHNGDVDSICRATPMYLSSDLPRESRVVGTQHGLICFSDYITGDACVLNPTTNEMRTFHFERQRYNRHNTFFGFGFDTINDDYKVVRISTRSNVNLAIEICQFRNTETRQIVVPLVQVLPFMLCNASTVVVDGSTHWIAFHPKNKNLQIVRFDMDLENFVEIPFSKDMPNINYDANTRGFEGLNLEGLSPEGFYVDGKRFRLGVFKESLCLFINDSLKVEIWLRKCKNLEDSHVAWTRMFEIPISRRIEDVVGFTANEEIIIRNENKDYFAYDPWKKRSIFPLGHNNREIPHAYVDSLVPVFPE